MTTFKDTAGRTWEVRITLGLLPRLRAAGLPIKRGATLGQTVGPLDDPDTLGQVLWAFCERQAEKDGVTPEQFAEGMDGPAISAAVGAVAGAITDFFQPPATAAAMRERLTAAMTEQDQTRAAAIRSGSTASAGSSPPSPDSTAPAEPSAS